MAKQAKTVLSLGVGLAARYDAIKHNPVRETFGCASRRPRRRR